MLRSARKLVRHASIWAACLLSYGCSTKSVPCPGSSVEGIAGDCECPSGTTWNVAAEACLAGGPTPTDTGYVSMDGGVTIVPGPGDASVDPTDLAQGVTGAAVISPAPNRLNVIARLTGGEVLHKWLVDAAWREELLVASGEPTMFAWKNELVGVAVRALTGSISVATIDEWDRNHNGPPIKWWHLEGATSFPPSAVSWDGVNHISVFIRGVDGAIWHRRRDSKRGWENEWYAWESLGGQIVSEPKAASWAEGRLDVFAQSTDGRLFHRAFDRGAWGMEEKFDTQISQPPTVIPREAGRIDIFFRTAVDDLLHWGKYELNAWSDQGVIPGTDGFIGTPEVIVNSKGTLKVLYRSSKNELLFTQRVTGWTPPIVLATGISASPAATWRPPNRLDVLTVSMDGTLRHQTFFE